MDITLRTDSEEEAIGFFESLRWPDGPVCPHCDHQGAYSIRASAKAKVRLGLWKCVGCRKQFTVRIGTIFEDSKLPLHKWLRAVRLIRSSKKEGSAIQLKRSLGVSYATAWSLRRRILRAIEQRQIVVMEQFADQQAAEHEESLVESSRRLKKYMPHVDLEALCLREYREKRRAIRMVQEMLKEEAGMPLVQ